MTGKNAPRRPDTLCVREAFCYVIVIKYIASFCDSNYVGQTTLILTINTFYRLRTPAETAALVLTLLAHGCPLQAIVVAFGFDERTVAVWGARAGRQGQAVQEYFVEQPRDLGHVQAAEIRVKKRAASCGWPWP